jgi:toxin HigB-1
VVEVSFEDADFAEICGNDRELRKRHGMVRAKKIQQRLKALQAAETLADTRVLPGRCHELHGDRAGQLSLDLDHPYRLLFRPNGRTGSRARRRSGLVGCQRCDHHRHHRHS